MTDIQMDLYPCCHRKSVIRGIVYDIYGKPLPESLVQLVRCQENCLPGLTVVSRTYSDCNGCYELQIPYPCEGKYRVEVGCNTAEIKRKDRRQNSICYY